MVTVHTVVTVLLSVVTICSYYSLVIIYIDIYIRYIYCSLVIDVINEAVNDFYVGDKTLIKPFRN